MRSIFFIILLFNFCASAQKPEGTFLDDSLWVGKPVRFSFTYLHKNESDIVFPDSNYNFKPFKLIDIEYFPTKSIKNKSLDSVIYTLVCYEIDPLFTLSLPIRFINNRKEVFSIERSIVRSATANEADIALSKLKDNTGYFQVPLDFNYPRLLYILLILLISSFLVFFIFGRKISKQLIKLKFYFKHREFKSSYKRCSKKPKLKKNITEALNLWKNEMEWIVKKPISSMTTKEITEALKSDRLNEALKEFDTALYAGIVTDHIPFAFNVIYDICIEHYKKRMRAL